MPRRSQRGPLFGLGETSDSSEEGEVFQSPERDENQTEYGLDFTTSRVIVNPFEPSTSRECRSGSGRRAQPTARKSTSVPARKSPRAQRSQVRPSLEPVAEARRRKQKKPRTRVWHEIKFLMKTTHLLIPRLPFGRLIKEIMRNVTQSTEVTRITAVALHALQESAEVYVTQQLQDAYTLTLHRGRVTLTVKDMELLRFLRGF